ncbi:MAG: hypothetical protein AAFP76_04580 [Bacteroidota bacterium]
MRPLVFLFFLWIYPLVSISQTEDLESKVEELRVHITASSGGEKLKWLDSLTALIKNRSEFQYDEAAREAIAYAVELDSNYMATKQTAHLIFYLSNRMGKPKEALTVFNEFTTTGNLSGDHRVLAELYLNGADSHYFSGEIEESIEIYKQAEAFALKAGDSVSFGAAKEYRADAHSNLGQFSEASVLLHEAEEVYTQINDTTRIILTQNSRANLYSQIGFYKEAAEERNEVISMAKRIKYYPALLSALYNAAIDDRKNGDYKARIGHLNEALALTRESEEFVDLYEPRLLNTLLEAYSRTDSLEKATLLLNEIESNLERNTKGVFERMYLEGKGHYHLVRKEFNLALKLGNEYLDKQLPTNDYENILDGHELLYQIHLAMNHSEEALHHYKQYTIIKDSIRGLQKARALSYYQTLYETEKRDAKIKGQEAEIELLDTKNRVQFQWMFLIALAFLGAGSFYYFNNKKNKHEAEIARNKRELAEMQNEMLNKEIAYKKKDLSDFAFNISQNQDWAKVLAEKLEKVKGTTGRQRAKELDDLETEIRNKIWVDEGSQNFQERIEELGSGFYDRLNSQFPGLTKTEIRLCSLIRMHVDNKEIAILQNIDPASVKKSRYRLRKKLALTPEQDLDAFLQAF